LENYLRDSVASADYEVFIRVIDQGYEYLASVSSINCSWSVQNSYAMFSG
jgi:hypothetical protein